MIEFGRKGKCDSISPVFFVYWRGHIHSMIGIQKQTKRFSLDTFFLVFFFAFFTNFSFDAQTVYAAPPALTGAETKAATPPPAAAPSKTPAASNSEKSSCGFDIECGFKWVLYGMLSFCSFLASMAASIFSYVLDVSHLQSIMSNAVIYEMWRIVRDFFNLFFIFSLLLVAFSTIFQVSKYGGFKSVWSIVLAALFINFSFPIARMIIDLGNVMMYSFINDIFGMTASSLNSGILSTSGLKGLFLQGGNFDKTLDIKFYFVAIVGMFMFGVSFLTLALMMFYRLFMLPILVMFAPIGFAGSAIPGMGGYSSQWWDKLIKNVFFGPIAVFMVMIAVKFLETLISSNIAGNNAVTNSMISADVASSTFLASIVYMTIPIMFFWIAITSAEKLSSEASGMANSFGSKFLKWTGKTAGMFGYRNYESWMSSGKKAKFTKYLAPSVHIKAWTDRSKEKEHHDMQAIDQAAGKMHDQLNDVISRFRHPIKSRLGFKHGKDVTNKEFEQVQHLVSEKRKEISDVSTNGDYVINELQHAINEKDSAKAEAALQILAKNNDLNDMIVEVGKRYIGMKDKDGKTDLIDVDASGDVVVSSKNMRNVLQRVMIDSGESNMDIITKKMLVLGDHATGAGNFAFGGMTKFDATLNGGRGGFKVSTGAEQAGWAAAKVKNLETQERQRRIHPDSIFTRTANGGFGDINGEVGAAIIDTFTLGDVGEAKRSRDDMKQAIYNAYQKMDDGNHEQFKALYKSNGIFAKYVKTVVDFKTDPNAGAATTP